MEDVLYHLIQNLIFEKKSVIHMPKKKELYFSTNIYSFLYVCLSIHLYVYLCVF